MWEYKGRSAQNLQKDCKVGGQGEQHKRGMEGSENWSSHINLTHEQKEPLFDSLMQVNDRDDPSSASVAKL